MNQSTRCNFKHSSCFNDDNQANTNTILLSCKIWIYGLFQIKKEYGRLIEEASEKIQISEDCYGLVDRYLRKLDQELHKFKVRQTQIGHKINFSFNGELIW